MARKLIGLPVWKLGENSAGSTLSYILFAERFGEVVLLMPNSSIRKDLDLLILPGGPDIDPARYGAYPDMYTQKPDIQKEYFDRVMLPKYIELGTPVLGICRGHQSIAVALSGKLIQHMNHETNKPEDPYKCVHKIKIDNLAFPTWPRFAYGEDNNDVIPHSLLLEVNSRHHQTVKENSLPDNLLVIARHEKDNHVEMIAHTELPILGIQAHPEDIYNPDTSTFVENLIWYLINERKSILKE